MELFTTSEMAKKWDVSKRRVRTFCVHGRIEGWNGHICKKPCENTLVEKIREQMK